MTTETTTDESVVSSAASTKLDASRLQSPQYGRLGNGQSFSDSPAAHATCVKLDDLGPSPIRNTRALGRRFSSTSVPKALGKGVGLEVRQDNGRRPGSIRIRAFCFFRRCVAADHDAVTPRGIGRHGVGVGIGWGVGQPRPCSL